MTAKYSTSDAFGYLVAQGYSPPQAAALVGNFMQESGMNPAALNEKEGAHGLMQWRLDRWDNLQKYARARGGDPFEPTVQLDFVREEMNGPESKAGKAFLAATDLAGANAALKGFIRYGDNSDAVRLGYAQKVLGGPPQPTTAPSSPEQAPQIAAGAFNQISPMPAAPSIPAYGWSPQESQQAQQPFGEPPQMAPLQMPQMRRPPPNFAKLLASLPTPPMRRGFY